jgi:murein DD-endopeptidase MepM/ murein hydrolase activator NlpD
LTLITSDFSNPDWLKNSQFATVASNPPANSSNPTTLPSALISQQPPAQVVAAQSAESSSADPTLYRVGPGDTLARIARRHHVSPAALISTNRISDPNFIFVGQVLRVPASQPSPSVPARESTSTASEAADKQAENSSQQVVAASVGGAAPTPVANNASQPAAPTPARNSPDTNSLQSNRYVENLLSEIRAMRDRHRNQANAPAERRTNQPAQTVAASPTARTTPAPVSLPAVRSTNPTFNPSRLDAAESAVNRNRPASRSEASRPTNTPARPGNRVAAAPAGSESYAPLLQPITGRMVSPDLPPLGGEDAYLPDGKPAFNGYIWPARGVFTSGFGWRWGRMHQGIDIAADVGTPIYAAADGVVESSGWNSGGYGNLVEIRHGDGSLTRYAHLDHSLVQKGQQVKQGEQIAEMGSTGYSTGPHLHFEVHLPGDEVVNPIAYLPQQQASGN